jgi:hypothetical protein
MAGFDRSIADTTSALAREGGETPTALQLASDLRAVLPALRARALEYQSNYMYYMRQTDLRSLEAMRAFIARARELHGDEPAFGFLFAD